jgi:hypothetical protein
MPKVARRSRQKLIEIFSTSGHLNACDHGFRSLARVLSMHCLTAIGYKTEVEASLSQREREGSKREHVSEKKIGVSFCAGSASLNVYVTSHTRTATAR